jgi:hypothetical protein
VTTQWETKSVIGQKELDKANSEGWEVVQAEDATIRAPGVNYPQTRYLLKRPKGQFESNK